MTLSAERARELTARLGALGRELHDHWDGAFTTIDAVPSREQLRALDAVFREAPELGLSVRGRGAIDRVDFLGELPSLRRLTLLCRPVAGWGGLWRAPPRLQFLEFWGDAKGAPVEPLAWLTELRELRLAHTAPGASLAGLASLTRLTELRFNHVPLEAAAVDALFSSLSSLASLSIEHGRLRSFAPLGRLPRLASLELCNPGPVASLVTWPETPSMRRLKLCVSRVADLRGIERSSNLQELRFGSSPVVDLGPIGAVRTLRSLSLFATKTVRVLPELSALRDLRSVELRHLGALDDIAALAGAPALRELEVYRCRSLLPAHFAPLAGHRMLGLAKIHQGSRRRDEAIRAALGLSSA